MCAMKSVAAKLQVNSSQVYVSHVQVQVTC